MDRLAHLHCLGFAAGLRDQLTQSSIRPPTFVVFTDKGCNMHFSTERYIMNQLRKRFGFQATPIVLKAKRR